MKFYGLDEAALGPRLGPFCVGLVEFDSGNEHPLSTDLYHILNDAITSERDDTNRPVVADSKKLYNSVRGIQSLEYNVGIFLELTGIGFPQTLQSLVHTLCPPLDYSRMKDSPWFEDSSCITLPLSNIEIDLIRRDAIIARQKMNAVKLRFQRPRLRFVTAKTFNELIITHQGKSRAVQSILNPLITHAMKSHDSEQGRFTIDRQGGRRYYAPWLVDLFPKVSFRVLEEGRKLSTYELGNFRVEFMVSADNERLETALASMFAKYLREVAMRNFNQWWTSKVKNIRPTAGYPQDARRFIQNLRDANQLPMNQDILIRRS